MTAKEFINNMNTKFGESWYNDNSMLEKALEQFSNDRFSDSSSLECYCCGNCYYMDIIQDKGGVCTFNNEEISCDRNGFCENWKLNPKD